MACCLITVQALKHWKPRSLLISPKILISIIGKNAELVDQTMHWSLSANNSFTLPEQQNILVHQRWPSSILPLPFVLKGVHPKVIVTQNKNSADTLSKFMRAKLSHFSRNLIADLCCCEGFCSGGWIILRLQKSLKVVFSVEFPETTWNICCVELFQLLLLVLFIANSWKSVHFGNKPYLQYIQVYFNFFYSNSSHILGILGSRWSNCCFGSTP